MRPAAGRPWGSVLESVANITGTYGATERAIERTGDALAAGNFTEVRLCGLKVTWQKPQLCQHSSWFPSQVVLLQLPVTMPCHSAGAQHAVPAPSRRLCKCETTFAGCTGGEGH